MAGARAPGLRDIAALSRSGISRDVGAGISVAAVAVPIGLAYAKLTGVPPEIGLYSSIVPTMAYALFGPSSRFLIVGPDTAICLLLAATITQLGISAPDERAAVAAGLTLLVGAGCILAALAKVGSIANLISRPVLVGYLTGVALTLLVSQLPSFTGVALTSSGLFQPFVELAHRTAEIGWINLGLAVGFFILLRVMKGLTPRLPAPAVVLVLGIALSYALDLSAKGVATIGTIPAGLPMPALPEFKGEPATLALSVLGLLIISFSSGILTVRSFAERIGQRTDPNKELVGFGAADIAAGLFQGFAVTGADSRTAVAISSGGRTALVGIIAGLSIALVVSFLTGPLALLPQAALGAILASAALNLLDFKAFAQLARIDRHELVFALVATAGVLWIGVLQGVFIAVAVTLAHLVRLASRPVDGQMGRHPAHGELVTLHSKPDAVVPNEGIIYLFQASVLFMNAEYFLERALEALRDKPQAKWFVLDASAMMHADSSAVAAFGRLKRELDGRGINLYVGGGHGQFREVMERSGMMDEVGRERLFVNAHLALLAAERDAEAAATADTPVYGERGGL